MIKVGTGGDRLAMAQAARVEKALTAAGVEWERVEFAPTVEPSDDAAARADLRAQLDSSLLRQDIDLAVHALADLPTRLADGTALVAVGVREHPADAFVSVDYTWPGLPRGARVATASPRRRAELLRVRPELDVVEIHGDVDARLATLRKTPLDGTILAVASLIRLGLRHRASTILPADIMLPHAGQGAIAVMARHDDDASRSAAGAYHDRISSWCTIVERSLLHELGGGDHTPIGVLATPRSHEDTVTVHLRARVLSLDGRDVVEGEMERDVDSVDTAYAMGVTLAERLLTEGAEAILQGTRSPPSS